MIAQIDAEMTDRLSAIANQADTAWHGFLDECVACIEIALEPEVPHVVLLDGPAVLGGPSRWPSQTACVRTTTHSLQRLIDDGTVRGVDAGATSRLISGTARSLTLDRWSR